MPDTRLRRAAVAPRRGPTALQLALGGAIAACALFAGILLAAWLVQRPGADSYSRGTAFRVGQDGLWLTAGHVIARCRAAPEIVLVPARAVPATVRRIDREADLAVIDTGTRGEPLALRLGQAAARRDIAHAVGIARGGPVGLAGVFVVTAPRSIDDSGREALRDVWVTRRQAPERADSLEGMSGSPLVDASGAVVGVLVAVAADGERVHGATGAQIAAILDGQTINRAPLLAPVERRVEADDLAGLRDRLVERGFVRPIRCAADGPIAATDGVPRQ